MYTVAADNSTNSSITRRVSRAAEIWLSAARTLFAVCWPLNRVWLPVTPIEETVLVPVSGTARLCVKAVPGIGGKIWVVFTYCLPTLAFAERVGR